MLRRRRGGTWRRWSARRSRDAAGVAAGFRLDLDARAPIAAEDIEAAKAAAEATGRAVATEASLDVLVVDEDGNLRRALAVAAALRRRGFAADSVTAERVDRHRPAPLARAAAAGVPWLAQVRHGAIQPPTPRRPGRRSCATTSRPRRTPSPSS